MNPVGAAPTRRFFDCIGENRRDGAAPTVVRENHRVGAAPLIRIPKGLLNELI